MAKKTIIGVVADTVTDAVVTTIEALAHPVKTARDAGDALAKARLSAAGKADRALRTGTRRLAARTKKAVSKVAAKGRRAVKLAGRRARKTAKQATRRTKRHR